MRILLAVDFNMADMKLTVAALTELKVVKLDGEWVRETWERDFMDFEPLPEATEDDVNDDDCHRSHLQNLLKRLSPWVEGKEDRGFWALLVDNDIPHRNLIAMLYHLLETGSKRVANGAQKEAGILAANVYFSLLCIPGSSAFKVFHPMLFEKSVNALKLWKQLDSDASTRKRKPSASQERRQSNTRKKARKTMEENSLEDDAAADDEGEELSPQEITAIHKALVQLLKGFVNLLGSYSLKANDQSAVHSIQTLCELVKQDPETFNEVFDVSNVSRVNAVPQLAYMGLCQLCSPTYGNVASIVAQVCRHLMPNLLMLLGDNQSVAATTIPRSAHLIKDHACAFILHLMKVHGDVIVTSVRTLIQHLCVKVPSKMEYRTRVAAIVVRLLRNLPVSTYARMVDWIYKLTRNAKIANRLFSLDIVFNLLSQPQMQADGSVLPEYKGLLTYQFLIQILVSRCSDIAPGVRARAIQVFATCSTSGGTLVKAALKDMMTPNVRLRPPMTRIVPTPQRPQMEATLNGETDAAKDPEENPEGHKETPASDISNIVNVTPVVTNDNHESSTLETPADPIGAHSGVILTPGGEISLADGKGVVSMLRRRVSDEKVNVRKASLQALENLIRLDGDFFNNKDLDVLSERCLDPALSVRKQAMQSLTDLLMEMPYNPHLHRAWLDGVLPMVLDRETSAQEKCFEVLEEIFVKNIVPYQRSKDLHHELTWSLLSYLASNKGVELRRFLQKACQQWGRTGKLKPSLSQYLQTHVATKNNQGAWLYLAQMAPFVAKLPTRFVVDYWNDVAKNAPESEYDTVHRVLLVLGHVAKNLPAEEAFLMAEEIKERLMRFDTPVELVTVSVGTLSKLCKIEPGASSEEAKRKADAWFEDLMKASDFYLSHVILDEGSEDPVDENQVIRHLFTLGEIAQLCPARTPKRVFMLVQSLIATPVITSVDGSSQFPRPGTPSKDLADARDRSSTGSYSSDVGSAGPSQPQGSWSSQIRPSQSQLSQFRGSKMSARVRAHAFVTLGKLCLQHEDLAKKCVPAMARELETATDPAIRNNVVIVMCDLCVRYTSVVDRYIPNIAARLRDESMLVRKQTLTLITHLLQEDFLKWKGSLFFRFIRTIVDESKDICEFAEFCLVHLLLQRHPGMFFHHFIECIFHFNSYEEHRMYNKFPQTDSDRENFSLKGKASEEKRRTVYTFLLNHLTDEQRFQLSAKLCQEVLAAIVDGVLPLDVDTSPILIDTLFILASKEIKLHMMKCQTNDEDVFDTQEMAVVVMNAAKKTIISQVMKKNVIENIVPVIIVLKNMLERQHSPALRYLMIYLRELMHDYKNEVKEILSLDRQLANEIEFDIRKFEEKQKEEEEQKRLQKEEEERKRLVQEQRSNPGTPVGSPLIQGSPVVTPGTASPARLLNLGGTPNDARPGPKAIKDRRVSTAMQAIMNSARKAVEKVALSPSRSPAAVRRVGWLDAQTEDKSDESPSEDVMKTPPVNRQRRVLVPRRDRAVSTPAGNTSVFGDITFHQGDLSLIPGSPRNSNENSDPGTPSWETQEKTGLRKPPQKPVTAVIHMMSPDHPRPKPRTWNVKSPAIPMQNLQQIDSDDDVFGSAAVKEPAKSTARGQGKERQVLAPRRGTRRSSRLENSRSNPAASGGSETEENTFVSLNNSSMTRRRR